MMGHDELVAFFRPYIGGPFDRKIEAFKAAREADGTGGMFLGKYNHAWNAALETSATTKQ